MRVFIAGATGVLGSRLVRQFSSRGHHVIGLARNEGNDRVIRSFGGEPRRADLFDIDSLVRAAEGADLVVHAATKIPARARVRPRDWAENDRIRREGTRALLTATDRVGARQYVQQSVVWLARPLDGSEFNEDSRFRNPHRALQSMIDAEAYVREASQRKGFVASIIRCGAFYSADSVHMGRMGEGVVRRRLPIVGDGSAIWRLIHVEDAASAFVTVAEDGRPGLWHAVDDEPVTVAAFLNALAERLGAPRPPHVPVWLARLAVGREAVSFFTDSTRTSNERFRRDFGWRPKYPTYREGLDEILTTWKAQGFPE